MNNALEALGNIRKIKVNGGFDTIDYYPIYREDLDIIETTLKAFEVAKKVLNYYSFAKYHIKNAYQDGWITRDEFILLESKLNEETETVYNVIESDSHDIIYTGSKAACINYLDVINNTWSEIEIKPAK